MGNWESDNNEFQKFADGLLKIAKSVKDGANSKKFLQKEGNKLRKKTVDKAKTTVKKYTGNYLKSIKKGKIYNFEGNLSLRVFSSSPHAHLIESGHIKKTPSGEERGFKPGYHVFDKAARDFEDEFVEDAEDFRDGLFENL